MLGVFLFFILLYSIYFVFIGSIVRLCYHTTEWLTEKVNYEHISAKKYLFCLIALDNIRFKVEHVWIILLQEKGYIGFNLSVGSSLSILYQVCGAKFCHISRNKVETWTLYWIVKQHELWLCKIHLILPLIHHTFLSYLPLNRADKAVPGISDTCDKAVLGISDTCDKALDCSNDSLVVCY